MISRSKKIAKELTIFTTDFTNVIYTDNVHQCDRWICGILVTKFGPISGPKSPVCHKINNDLWLSVLSVDCDHTRAVAWLLDSLIILAWQTRKTGTGEA